MAGAGTGNGAGNGAGNGTGNGAGTGVGCVKSTWIGTWIGAAWTTRSGLWIWTCRSSGLKIWLKIGSCCSEK